MEITNAKLVIEMFKEDHINKIKKWNLNRIIDDWIPQGAQKSNNVEHGNLNWQKKLSKEETSNSSKSWHPQVIKFLQIIRI